jgi:hypothetical protein
VVVAPAVGTVPTEEQVALEEEPGDPPDRYLLVAQLPNRGNLILALLLMPDFQELPTVPMQVIIQPPVPGCIPEEVAVELAKQAGILVKLDREIPATIE